MFDKFDLKYSFHAIHLHLNYRVCQKCIHILRKEKKNYIKIAMVLRSSNDNRASAIFVDRPACHMVTLAFIWLTPSFERTSYYILLP
jgi:hypothetical protein